MATSPPTGPPGHRQGDQVHPKSGKPLSKEKSVEPMVADLAEPTRLEDRKYPACRFSRGNGLQVVALVSRVLGGQGKGFDQVAREAARRDAAEDALAQNFRPRGPGQKTVLGFGIGGGNGEDVSGMERRVEITEEIGEAAGARERDGAWPLAIAHAIHSAQADAPARGRAVGKNVRYGVRQTPAAPPVKVGVIALAPVTAAQADRKSQSVVTHRAHLPVERGKVGSAVTICVHVKSCPAATPGLQEHLVLQSIFGMLYYNITFPRSLIFGPVGDLTGQDFRAAILKPETK